MPMHFVVSPAYGRDYRSKAAAIADWEADKDFVIEGPIEHAGRYINRPDAGHAVIEIRYCRKMKVTVVRPKAA
jgi:hypothetical protein